MAAPMLDYRIRFTEPGRVGRVHRTVHADEPEQAVERLIQVVTERIPKRFGFDPVRDIQVLTPMNRGELGARNLNVLLQA